MYKKSKKLAALLMMVNFATFSLIGTIPASAAIGELPEVAFIGIDHSPLVEGETEAFTVTSTNYRGQVQYRAWLNKADTDEWVDITGGYTPAVNSSTPYEIKYSKPFELGSYKLITWVKAAGTNGTKTSSFGEGYDNLWQANLNCVNKDANQRVYANGDMDISRDAYAVGESVVVNGIKDISGIPGPYSYKLHLFRPDKASVSQSGWSTDVTSYDTKGVVWSPTEAGSYVLDVWATAPSSLAKYESWKLKSITVEDATIYKEDGSLIGSEESGISAVQSSTQVASTEILPMTAASKVSTIDKSISIMGKNISAKNVTINGNVYLTGNNVNFKNITVNGTLYVDPGKTGTANFDTVTAKTIQVVSGSKEGIKFTNVKYDTLKTLSNDLVKVGTANTNSNTGTNGTTGTTGATTGGGTSGGASGGSSAGSSDRSSSGSNSNGTQTATVSLPSTVQTGQTYTLSSTAVSAQQTVNTSVNLGGQTVNVGLTVPSVQAGASVKFEAVDSKLIPAEVNPCSPINIELGNFGGINKFDVKLDLPVAATGMTASNLAAYHYNSAINTWEYRGIASIIDGKVIFSTNLSPVMLAKKVNVPNNLNAAADGGKVTLAWASVSDDSLSVTKYIVYNENNEIVGETSDKTIVLSSVADGVHTYTVRGYKVYDSVKFESAASNTVTVTVTNSNIPTPTPDPTPTPEPNPVASPQAVTNLVVSTSDTDTLNVGGVQNIITWDASATSGVIYDVLRRTGSETADAVKIASDLNTLTYTDINATPAAIYYYSVVTKNSAGAAESELKQVVTAVDQQGGIAAVNASITSCLSEVTTSGAVRNIIDFETKATTTTQVFAYVYRSTKSEFDSTAELRLTFKPYVIESGLTHNFTYRNNDDINPGDIFYYFIVLANEGGQTTSEAIKIETVKPAITINSTNPSLFTINVPSSGTSIASFISEVKDKDNNILTAKDSNNKSAGNANAYVKWSLKTPVDGVTLSDSINKGAVNVNVASTTNASSVTLVANFGSITAEKEINLVKLRPTASTIVPTTAYSLNGVSQVTTTGAVQNYITFKLKSAATTSNSWRVYRSTNNTFDEILSFKSITNTSTIQSGQTWNYYYTNNGSVVPGTVYYYFVVVENEAGKTVSDPIMVETITPTVTISSSASVINIPSSGITTVSVISIVNGNKDLIAYPYGNGKYPGDDANSYVTWSLKAPINGVTLSDSTTKGAINVNVVSTTSPAAVTLVAKFGNVSTEQVINLVKSNEITSSVNPASTATNLVVDFNKALNFGADMNLPSGMVAVSSGINVNGIAYSAANHSISIQLSSPVPSGTTIQFWPGTLKDIDGKDYVPRIWGYNGNAWIQQ